MKESILFVCVLCIVYFVLKHYGIGVSQEDRSAYIKKLRKEGTNHD